MSEPVEPLYFTSAELAKLVNVSVATISRWAASDPTMPSIRIGSVLRFHRERVLRWLEAKLPEKSRQKRPQQVGR